MKGTKYRMDRALADWEPGSVFLSGPLWSLRIHQATWPSIVGPNVSDTSSECVALDEMSIVSQVLGHSSHK